MSAGALSHGRHHKTGRYRQHVRKYFRMVLPLLGATPADALKPADVAKARDHLAHSFAPGTVRVCLAYFAAAFEWAMKLGIVATNPVRGIERPTADSSIDYYTRDEVLVILSTAFERAELGQFEHMLAVLVQLAVHTGLRRGELLGLKWGQGHGSAGRGANQHRLGGSI